jgi:hypothetical protein
MTTPSSAKTVKLLPVTSIMGMMPAFAVCEAMKILEARYQ